MPPCQGRRTCKAVQDSARLWKEREGIFSQFSRAQFSWLERLPVTQAVPLFEPGRSRQLLPTWPGACTVRAGGGHGAIEPSDSQGFGLVLMHRYIFANRFRVVAAT